MKRIHVTTLFLIFGCLAALPAMVTMAQDTPSPADGGQPPLRQPLTPMMQEIHAVLAESDAAVEALQQTLKTVPDELQSLALLRAIAQQKQDTEIAILHIQARYAREAGQQAAVDKIEAAIEQILNPKPIPPSPEARAELEARRAQAQSGGDHHE